MQILFSTYIFTAAHDLSENLFFVTTSVYAKDEQKQEFLK